MTKWLVTVIILVVAFLLMPKGWISLKLDLRPMLRGEVSRIPVDFTIVCDEIPGVTVEGDILISGEIVDTAGYMRMELIAKFDYVGECARCLDEVRDCFETEFVRTVVDEGTLTEEQLEENVDEYAVISDGFLDIDEQLREAVILDFPTKILCSDDCPGLCQICGKPLKDGDCSCTVKEVDPRWAVLKGFFDSGDDNSDKGKN